MISRALLGLAVACLGIFLLLASPTRPVRGDDKTKGKSADVDYPKDLTPRPFTLQGKDIDLKTALMELSKQTGNTVMDRRGEKGETKIKLDLKKVTFWQALDAIAKEADARVLFERGGKVALAEGPYLAMPVSYNGLFRVSVKRLETSLLLDSEGHTCLIRLDVAWEPRFKPLLIETMPDSLILQDDKGRTIEVPDAGKGKGRVNDTVVAEIDVPLPAPQRSANRLAVFKGKLSIVGPSKMVSFTFDKLAKIQKKDDARKITQDGVTLHLKELRTEGDDEEPIWMMGLMLEYPGDSAKAESFQSFVVNNEIYLEKEKDGIKQRFPQNLGYETSGDDSDGKTVVRYRFGDQPEKKLVVGNIADWKLVYRMPGKIVELPIPFEFKDLPLP